MGTVKQQKKTESKRISPRIIVNPQWQGGGDIVTYYGAKELERLYLQKTEYTEIPVNLDTQLLTENRIVGYADISRQMKSASHLLKQNSFNQVFSIGGGCDADVPVIAHLNQLYAGNLFVLWMDAHGDLNSPEESRTGLFYGMPARILLGESGLFKDIIEKPLKPWQLMHIGGRDFDEPELRYLRQKQICQFSSASFHDLRTVLEDKKACSIYVHLDLDVLRPDEFPNTPLPVAGGVSGDEVLALLDEIKHNHAFAGLGLYEYAPCGGRSMFIATVFDMMLGR